MSSQLINMQPIFIKVNGQDLPPTWFFQLELVEVDLTIGAPDMVTLTFIDTELKLVDDAIFAHGKDVEISAKDAAATPVVITSVEVASLEPDFRADGSAHFVVRGYSKWNRLHNGRKSKTYLRTKDSDIASTIAQAAQLRADVTLTDETYEYVVQWQQTDMEFLMARAERIGYEVYQEADKLAFKPAATDGAVERTFSYANNLIRFQPRLSVAGQFNDVKVIGWDRAQKQLVVGTGSDTTVQGGMGKSGGAAAQAANRGSVTELVTDGAVVSASDAQTVAKSIASRVNGEFFEADGECEAAPGLKPGMLIKIENVGTRFSGTYRVTGVHHTWSAEGMRTRFTVLGRNGASLAQAMQGPPMRRRVDGLLIAVVTNLNDPNNLGRIKVKFPTLMPDDSGAIESDWARVATPMAGPSTGMMFLPEVNDEVLCGFEDGDPAHPVVVGYLWNGRDKPPLGAGVAQSNGVPGQRIIKTKAGHQILIEDKSGSEKIEIKDKIGNFLLLDAANKLIHLKDSGGNEVKLDGQGRSVLVKSIGNLNIEAAQALTIKGLSVTIESSGGAMNVKSATTMLLSANATAELSANGPLTVKTSAILQIQGSLVKIN